MKETTYNKVKKVWWYESYTFFMLLKDRLSKEKSLKEIENFENTSYLVDPSSFVLNDKMTPNDIRNRNMKPFFSRLHLEDLENFKKDFQDLKVSVIALEETAKSILKKEEPPRPGLLKKAILLRDKRR